MKAKFKNEEKLHAVRLADALAHKAQGTRFVGLSIETRFVGPSIGCNLVLSPV